MCCGSSSSSRSLGQKRLLKLQVAHKRGISLTQRSIRYEQIADSEQQQRSPRHGAFFAMIARAPDQDSNNDRCKRFRLHHQCAAHGPAPAKHALTATTLKPTHACKPVVWSGCDKRKTWRTYPMTDAWRSVTLQPRENPATAHAPLLVMMGIQASASHSD